MRQVTWRRNLVNSRYLSTVIDEPQIRVSLIGSTKYRGTDGSEIRINISNLVRNVHYSSNRKLNITPNTNSIPSDSNNSFNW